MKIAKASPFSGSPIINLPAVYGACVGKEILCRIPVIGKRPIQIKAEGLIPGLKLKDGIISGKVNQECEFCVHIYAENEIGSTTSEVIFKIGEDTMLLTPLMGFTSWNAFSEFVTQTAMEKTADKLLALGIADYGYNYMNIDSGWQKEYGGKYDAIMPNEKFPDMKAYCDRMHSMGLKCGIYSTPMLTAWGCPPEFTSIPGCTRGEADILYTCVNEGIGVERLEANNVKQWEEWGFDYLKYDWRPTDPVNADYMKKELLKANREIAFCVTLDANWEYHKYWQRNCTSWRCNLDSRDNWESLKRYIGTVGKWEDVVCQGHYYDLDMLEISGMRWNEGKTRLTENEAIFAYTLRAFFLSPIQLSCDLDTLTEFEYDLICNEEIIKINQDGLSDYPKLLEKNEESTVRVYKRKLENGDDVIAVFNLCDFEIDQKLDLHEYSTARDLWIKEDVTISDDFSCVVEPHCVKVLRVSK